MAYGRGESETVLEQLPEEAFPQQVRQGVAAGFRQVGRDLSKKLGHAVRGKEQARQPRRRRELLDRFGEKGPCGPAGHPRAHVLSERQRPVNFPGQVRNCDGNGGFRITVEEGVAHLPAPARRASTAPRASPSARRTGPSPVRLPTPPRAVRMTTTTATSWASGPGRPSETTYLSNLGAASPCEEDRRNNSC